MRQPVTDAAAIAVEVVRIHALAPDGLRRTWRAVFGRTPPASLSTGLLARMIAWHIQERAFGGLGRDSRRFLDSLARAGGSPRRRLKPGTVLVRDYRLAGDELLEPLSNRPRHHRHGLERPPLLRLAGTLCRGQTQAQISRCSTQAAA